MCRAALLTRSLAYAHYSRGPGKYEVFIYYFSSITRATAIPVAITHGSGTHTTSMNQASSNPGGFVSMGAFDFAVGPASVTISSPITGLGTLKATADAVQWKCVGEASEPVMPTTCALTSQVTIDEDNELVVFAPAGAWTRTPNAEAFQASLRSIPSTNGGTATYPVYLLQGVCVCVCVCVFVCVCVCVCVCV